MSKPPKAIETDGDVLCECEDESRDHIEADERGRRPCTGPGCACENFTPVKPPDEDDPPNPDAISPETLIGIP